MEKDGSWKVSPGYDLTFSEGPRGEHQLDICGEARLPSRKHLLQLANKTGIAEPAAVQSIERIVSVAENFCDFVGDLPIRAETVKFIEKAIKLNCDRLI